jgi:Ala-tRNA(Pro) deacylase
MMQHGIRYDVVMHPHSSNSMETAELAHVRGACLAKAVVLEDDDGHHVMAVLPSTRHVKMGELCRELNRDLHMMTEQQLSSLFSDCEPGAVPAIGFAYGITTVIDESLNALPEIYFEAGDHQSLIRLDRAAFIMLMQHAGRARFAVH